MQLAVSPAAGTSASNLCSSKVAMAAGNSVGQQFTAARVLSATAFQNCRLAVGGRGRGERKLGERHDEYVEKIAVAAGLRSAIVSKLPLDARVLSGSSLMLGGGWGLLDVSNNSDVVLDKGMAYPNKVHGHTRRGVGRGCNPSPLSLQIQQHPEGLRAWGTRGTCGRQVNTKQPFLGKMDRYGLKKWSAEAAGNMHKTTLFRKVTIACAATASNKDVALGSSGLEQQLEEEEEEEKEEEKELVPPLSTTVTATSGKLDKSVIRSLKGAGVTSFYQTLSSLGLTPLERRSVGTLQLNIGLYCNQACAHCHVESSPLRTEMMDHRTAAHIIDLLGRSTEIAVVDLTGGAPELNSAFRYLVKEARRLGKEVIDRCNLTVLFEEGQEDLADFLAENQVRVVASLPCYSAENVSKQRGGGVFEKSIAALQKLNSLGYGKEGSPLQLDLVYNPVGASLPPPQDVLADAYKVELFEAYGITFNNLFTVTNMPIKRFADYLYRRGELESYMNLLVSSFNSAAVEGVMCRDMVSVGWDGTLFDCDFNQQLGLGVGEQSVGSTVFDLQSFNQLIGRRIAVDDHCYGCTAGHGSSCTGALTA